MSLGQLGHTGRSPNVQRKAAAFTRWHELRIPMNADSCSDYVRLFDDGEDVTDVQVFLPRVESITLHDVPGEEHETEMVIHDECGATVSVRLISDRRIRLTDLRRR